MKWRLGEDGPLRERLDSARSRSPRKAGGRFHMISNGKGNGEVVDLESLEEVELLD